VAHLKDILIRNNAVIPFAGFKSAGCLGFKYAFPVNRMFTYAIDVRNHKRVFTASQDFIYWNYLYTRSLGKLGFDNRFKHTPPMSGFPGRMGV
jgi:hypothetical protein